MPSRKRITIECAKTSTSLTFFRPISTAIDSSVFRREVGWATRRRRVSRADFALVRRGHEYLRPRIARSAVAPRSGDRSLPRQIRLINFPILLDRSGLEVLTSGHQSSMAFCCVRRSMTVVNR
jgi:hypothetical protein